MNGMARESIWYVLGLLFQVLWSKKSENNQNNEPIIDIINNQQATSNQQITWFDLLWNMLVQNSGLTTFSALVFGRWIVSALWQLIKHRLFNSENSILSTPTTFHEGMNVNKWLKEFEEYADRCRCSEPDKRARELLKFVDDNCRRILKKSLKCEDEAQKIYYPAFKQQMALLFVTTKIKQREAKLKLYNRDQAEDESITRYYYELMNLASEAFPGADQSVLDAYVHEQFLHGIRNPMVKRRLVNDYGKASELQDVVRVAKMYEEEEENENKADRKKEYKIKKVLYRSDYSDSSEEEQHIRRFERFDGNARSFQRNRNHHRDNSWNRNQNNLREFNNTMPAKHYNEVQEIKNSKIETPKKTVTVDETANMLYENERERRCYNCDGKFHLSNQCPFKRQNRYNSAALSTSLNEPRAHNFHGRQRAKSEDSRI